MRAEPSAVLFSVGSNKCKVRVGMERIDFRKWGERLVDLRFADDILFLGLHYHNKRHTCLMNL